MSHQIAIEHVRYSDTLSLNLSSLLCLARHASLETHVQPSLGESIKRSLRHERIAEQQVQLRVRREGHD